MIHTYKVYNVQVEVQKYKMKIKNSIEKMKIIVVNIELFIIIN